MSLHHFELGVFARLLRNYTVADTDLELRGGGGFFEMLKQN